MVTDRKAQYMTRIAEPTDLGWFTEVEVLKPMISRYRILGKVGQIITVDCGKVEELVKNGFVKEV